MPAQQKERADSLLIPRFTVPARACPSELSETSAEAGFLDLLSANLNRVKLIARRTPQIDTQRPAFIP
jgi:hypothetical protein